jgi:hypothetical protein
MQDKEVRKEGLGREGNEGGGTRLVESDAAIRGPQYEYEQCPKSAHNELYHCITQFHTVGREHWKYLSRHCCHGQVETSLHAR